MKQLFGEDRVQIRVVLSLRRLKTAVIAIILFNLCFLVGSALFARGFYSLTGSWEDAPFLLKYVGVQFNLAVENVLAAWYSAILLLLTAVLSFLCYLADADRQLAPRDQQLSKGWLLLSFLFLGLSLDEVGTLHEGIGTLTFLNPFGDYELGWVWVLLIPIALVGLFMLAFAWFHLWRNKPAALFFALGVILFLTIPLQERVEELFLKSAVGARPISGVLLEEGTELFGTLVLLVATAVYFRHASQGTLIKTASLATVLSYATGGILVMAAAFWGVEWLGPYLSLGRPGIDGIPANWFPAVLAFGVGLLCWLICETAEPVKRPFYLVTAAFCVLLSGYYGANGAGYLYDGLLNLGSFALPLHQFFILTAVLLGVWLVRQSRVWWSAAAIGLGVLLLVVGWWVGQAAVIPLSFVALALWGIGLLPHLQTADSNRPATTFKTLFPALPPGGAVYLYDLLYELVIRDIKLRYKGSVLGVAWSLLNPLAQLVVFSFVFRLVLPLDIPNYTAFLFTGLLAWSWFQSSLVSSATALIDGRQLIKRPGFPSAILPIVNVAANLVHFLLAIPVLFFFLVVTGITPSAKIIYLPMVIVLQFLFSLSLAYFVAVLHVYFRDTQHLIGVFLLLLFYLTPIFYDGAAIPERYQPIYRLNPVLHLLEAYRNILIWGVSPHWRTLFVLGGVSAVLLVVGYRLFVRASYTFVEEL